MTDMTGGRDETYDNYAEWTILELMGHRRLAGYVQEATIAGGAFLRIDVYGAESESGGMVAGGIYEPGEPPDEPIATQFVSPSSVYAMTPTTEEVCRRIACEPSHGDDGDDGHPTF